MKSTIIADIGINHNGDIAIARRMIDAAAEAKADYVKFQTFVPEKLISVPILQHQEESGKTVNEDQLEILRRVALPEVDLYLLMDYCSSRGIGFMSSPFDDESIDLLQRFDINTWNIPSEQITDYPYLIKIAKTGKPVILSTGMSPLEEIGEALSVLITNGVSKENITLLHCTTEYPTPYNEVYLDTINRLSDIFGVKTGYSDHTERIAIPIAAATLGAQIIEKNFTLDRNMEGLNHKFAIEPEELKQMVTSIRAVESAINCDSKQFLSKESTTRTATRKSIVAATSICKGELFSETNLTTKRPGTGISPMKWNEIIGKPANKDYKPDEMIFL